MKAPDTFEAMLAKFGGATRPEQVSAALRGLWDARREAHVMICEAAYEAYAGRYWKLVPRPDGKPHRCWSVYFKYLLGVELSRSMPFWYVRIGRLIRQTPAGERNWLREQFSRLPIARVRTLMPAMEKHRLLAERSYWLDRAAAIGDRGDLAVAVSRACIPEGKGLRPRQYSLCEACGQRIKARHRSPMRALVS